MFNRGPCSGRRNAMRSTPPPYNRGSWELRRNAKVTPPPPYFGATTSSQKCQLLIAPMGRANQLAQQCQLVGTLPTLQQGVVNSPQKCLRRCTPTLQQGATQMTQKCQEAHAPNLFGAAQHAQRCHSTGAPTTRGHSKNAEMSGTHRLA